MTRFVQYFACSHCRAGGLGGHRNTHKALETTELHTTQNPSILTSNSSLHLLKSKKTCQSQRNRPDQGYTEICTAAIHPPSCSHLPFHRIASPHAHTHLPITLGVRPHFASGFRPLPQTGRRRRAFCEGLFLFLV